MDRSSSTTTVRWSWIQEETQGLLPRHRLPRAGRRLQLLPLLPLPPSSPICFLCFLGEHSTPSGLSPLSPCSGRSPSRVVVLPVEAEPAMASTSSSSSALLSLRMHGHLHHLSTHARKRVRYGRCRQIVATAGRAPVAVVSLSVCLKKCRSSVKQQIYLIACPIRSKT